MAAFDPFDTEPHFVSSTEIHESHRLPIHHHKKNSTFANVPFAETNGMDDFYGFTPKETMLNQEIKELKDIVRESQDLIDTKNGIIRALREEVDGLKQLVGDLRSQDVATPKQFKMFPAPPPPPPPPPPPTVERLKSTARGTAARSSISRISPHSILTKGSALFSHQNRLGNPLCSERVAGLNKTQCALSASDVSDDSGHDISPSLNHFLDNLEVKFKDDPSVRTPNALSADAAASGGQHVPTPSNTPYPAGGTGRSPPSDDDVDYYVSTAAMDTEPNGQFPHSLLQRSSLSEEEIHKMEQQAVADQMQRDGEGAETVGAAGFSNLVFNDSNVAKMNMNIITHHSHHTHTQSPPDRQSEVERLRRDVRRLSHDVERATASKLHLVRSSALEMDRLRRIIREHIK